MISMVDRLNQKGEVTALSHAVENKMPAVPEVEIYEDITDIGRDITIKDVSEEAEPGKIPIRSVENFVEHEEIRLINPDFPLPHGLRWHGLRATGTITSGNNYVDIDIGFMPNMCILGAQVKCLVAAGIGSGNYWHAYYRFNSVNIQQIDKTDYIDAIGIGFESPFDANIASAIIPTGTLHLRIGLDVNATTDGEYDVVVFIQDFIACDTSS